MRKAKNSNQRQREKQREREREIETICPCRKHRDVIVRVLHVIMCLFGDVFD